MRVHRGNRLQSAALSLAVAIVACWSATANAQFVQQAVGGISVNAEGVLTRAQVDFTQGLRQQRLAALAAVPAELNEGTPLRKVSLRGLEAALAEHLANGTPIPDEAKYLAGLQRIRYIFIVPEQNDIVLVGPGEGWTVDEDGTIVGVTTGRPVLLLEDLVVALASAREAANGGITCSIDPTPEGIQRLRAFTKAQGTIGSDPAATIAEMERQLGPQTITVLGVPPTSHFARVLVAADYRMKRLAMKFEEPPVRGLPSYLDMIPARVGNQNMMPRWWLATNYDALLTDPEGLSWELRGTGVKAMTEDDFVGADGQVRRTGQASPIAQKWADNMTAVYEELSAKDPIFGELRNIMDLAVVSALLVKEDLLARAGLTLPTLTTAEELRGEEFNVPRQVASIANYVKKGRNWLIATSGGVQINSWHVADRKETSADLRDVRSEVLAAPARHWWWN